MNNELIMETNIPELGLPRRGKVRDIYSLTDNMLIVVTDRLSAFDVVLPTGIQDKGKILNQMSLYWFRKFEDIVPNHIITADAFKYPPKWESYREVLRGRSMLVKKALPFPAEFIMRGYLAGSGWKSYQETGKVCGIQLPSGLQESQKLPEPIFTPSTKAESGHDVNVTFSDLCEIIGSENARKIRIICFKIYLRASKIAEERGIIIADTKLEFGIIDNKIALIDEVVTPDSSRFWSKERYEIGRGQDSYDKQPVRDYLETLDWNKQHPGPKLPLEIVEKTTERYREIFRILTGRELE
jgi:phosphoribosylaminoimidazole-succinocarboxamide synthase